MTSENYSLVERTDKARFGVHIEEFKPERPFGLQTGVPLFVGFARHANLEAGSNTLNVTTWEHFMQDIGPSIDGGFLDYAVRGFFENGGQRCVVAPLAGVEINAQIAHQAIKNAFRQGGALEDIEDVDLVCVPDIMMTTMESSKDLIKESIYAVLTHCENMRDRFAILDSVSPEWAKETVDEGLPESEKLQNLLRDVNAPRSKYGAVYFPWIRVPRLGRDKGIGSLSVPPSGHLAGIYANTDRKFGVHRAPANIAIEGALDFSTQISDGCEKLVNSFGINCMRNFPGRGNLVWGARTLSGDSGWRYINVRRLFLTFRRWVYHNMNDLLFEPHTPFLWEKVRSRLWSYCYGLFKSGALKGRSPSEAFKIKCDAEINPLEVQMAGTLNAEVCIAPTVPAEFLVIRITQSATGMAVTTSNHE